ncbi:hypothetical protein ACFWN1_23475, partial [Streptomyces sp. NPDC058459]
MAEQLNAALGEFGYYLDGLLARLDQGAGWCGVFWRRDPDGMRACREGREVPPWDVVDALLRDLAAAYGTAPALAERERARLLHTAALTAYDARPGTHDTLTRRLDATLRECHDADEREAALTRRLAEATGHAEAEALRVDLAWARDDSHRATARCAELRDRLARVSRAPADPHPYAPGQTAPVPAGPGRARADRPGVAGGAPLASGGRAAAFGRSGAPLPAAGDSGATVAGSAPVPVRRGGPDIAPPRPPPPP